MIRRGHLSRCVNIIINLLNLPHVLSWYTVEVTTDQVGLTSNRHPTDNREFSSHDQDHSGSGCVFTLVRILATLYYNTHEPI